MTKMLDKASLPYIYLECWTENQSPLGSGENWPMYFEDCAKAYGGDDAEEEAMEAYGKCDSGCPCYKAVETEICEKHDREFIKDDYCPECEAEFCFLCRVKELGL